MQIFPHLGDSRELYLNFFDFLWDAKMSFSVSKMHYNSGEIEFLIHKYSLVELS